MATIFAWDPLSKNTLKYNFKTYYTGACQSVDVFIIEKESFHIDRLYKPFTAI